MWLQPTALLYVYYKHQFPVYQYLFTAILVLIEPKCCLTTFVHLLIWCLIIWLFTLHCRGPRVILSSQPHGLDSMFSIFKEQKSISWCFALFSRFFIRNWIREDDKNSEHSVPLILKMMATLLRLPICSSHIQLWLCTHISITRTDFRYAHTNVDTRTQILITRKNVNKHTQISDTQLQTVLQ